MNFWGSQKRAVLYDESETNTWALGYHKFPHFLLSYPFISGFILWDVLTIAAVWASYHRLRFDFICRETQLVLPLPVSRLTVRIIRYLPLSIYTLRVYGRTRAISLVALTATSAVFFVPVSSLVLLCISQYCIDKPDPYFLLPLGFRTPRARPKGSNFIMVSGRFRPKPYNRIQTFAFGAHAPVPAHTTIHQASGGRETLNWVRRRQTRLEAIGELRVLVSWGPRLLHFLSTSPPMYLPAWHHARRVLFTRTISEPPPHSLPVH